MSLIKLLLHGGSVVRAISEITDELDDEEQQKERRVEKIKAGLYTDLTEFEKKTKTSNFFYTGWRHAIGWVTVMAMFYQFVAYPVIALFIDVPPVDPVMQEIIYSLVTLALGIAGLRSFDKVKGTDTGQYK